MDNAAGIITSALIVAVCFAALHSLVDLRRKQAKAAGIPYFDGARRLVLAVAAFIAAGYSALLLIALAGS